jgi:ABC-type lipoprotein export system ATPase subunit
MKILSFEVIGLNGRHTKVAAEHVFSDLNIFTGRNGAGKTNLLKLLWYIMSGNILLALKEVAFQKATLRTDLYDCTVIRTSPYNCRVEFTNERGDKSVYEDSENDDDGYSYSAEDGANPVLQALGGSVFFPTFRRIEGGFTLDTEVTPRSPFGPPPSSRKNTVEEGLQVLSRKLTHENHIFVAAMSTVDIVTLLLRRYTDLSEISNRSQQEASQKIIARIKEYRSEDDARELGPAMTLIEEIRRDVEHMEERRLQVMTPIEEVRAVVQSLFQETSIKIGSRLSFGDAASAVNSSALSAGEKQMLSFICYNAFYRDSVIFIDEPELSLHVDWQRQLFPILQKQQSSNQFVIATHSPFIYSKYPEKEISINSDRGDAGE